MKPEELNNIVTERFAHYLRANKLRATPERWEILKAVYELKGHFGYDDIERKVVKTNKFRVSRATIYNTIDHLIRANLLVKHQFSGESYYEGVVGREPHVHVICTKCGTCTEVPCAEIPVEQFTGRRRMFDTHWVGYVFGDCAKCYAQEKKAEKNKSNK